MTATKRMLQLGEEIREQIAMMFARGEVSDPRVKSLTIHSVKMTSDLQIAKVYYTPREGVTDLDSLQKGLRQASRFIRRELGKHLSTRTVPEIFFYYDDSLDYSIKMGQIMAEVRKDLRAAEAEREFETNPATKTPQE